jgi:RNA polymerase sigma-70 factor (ECF subfamily)
MRPLVKDPAFSDPLVERARAGDRSAQGELFTRHRERLRAFIASRLRPGLRAQVDPDDVLQEAFARALASLKSFRGRDEEDFRRWLAGVAAKTLLRLEAQARRGQLLRLESDLPAPETSPSRALNREETFERFQGAFDSLKSAHREVIHLTRIQGLTMREAAARMGRSPEAVKKLFWRALKELRKAMPESGSGRLPWRELKLRRGNDALE